MCHEYVQRGIPVVSKSFASNIYIYFITLKFTWDRNITAAINENKKWYFMCQQKSID